MIRLAIKRHTGVTGMQVLVMWVERNSLVARQVDTLPEPDEMRDRGGSTSLKPI